MMMMMMKLVVVVSAVLLLMADSSVTERILSRRRRMLNNPLHAQGIRDPFGSYCERRGGCCEGRNDECTMPYLDTICYCDLFCNRTVSDCCPDFWGHCLGIQPPPRGAMSHVSMNKCALAAGFSICLGFEGPTVLLSSTVRLFISSLQCRRIPEMVAGFPPPIQSTCSASGQWVCEQHACLIEQDMIQAVNWGNHGWKAANYSQFWGMSLDEGLRYRLGTRRPSRAIMSMNEIQTLPPALPEGPRGVPRPAERHSLSSVSWVFPGASSQWGMPRTPLQGDVPEASKTDARATSTARFRCGGAAALLRVPPG
ncbi:hypothetical protein QTP86_009254 [Hemibagrus guttatus]|nr:hypothetical protein QTP86_009254 [Hemibagrus guttatus]